MAQRLVVVGVDCSPASDTTLDWALESAARRGSRIDVVHAWTWGAVTSEFMVPEAPAQLAEAASTAVSEQVERALARRPAGAPAVEVRACALEGDPAAVLVRAAASADALVLGRHGQSALTKRLVGPVLGGVAAYCLARSDAPVAVVPTRTSAELPARVVVGRRRLAPAARARCAGRSPTPTPWACRSSPCWPGSSPPCPLHRPRPEGWRRCRSGRPSAGRPARELAAGRAARCPRR